MISADSMRSELLSLDSVRETLARTEPVDYISLSRPVRWHFGPNWDEGLAEKDSFDLLPITVSVAGRDYPITKEALFSATAACGLRPSYVAKLPSRFLAPQLEYWFSGGRIKNQQKLVLVNHVGTVVTRESVTPFSNLRLLSEALDVINEFYGSRDVWVDRKFTHTFQQTHLRLVIPEKLRTIENTGIPADNWSVGLQICNSLSGAIPTTINGYLFRWWCTNGAVTTGPESAVWKRKLRVKSDEDVYEWAKDAIELVLEGLEKSLDQVQHTAEIDVTGELADTLEDIFVRAGLPIFIREKVVAQLLDHPGPRTMYTVMNAITRAANDPEMQPMHVRSLMTLGGSLPAQVSSRCNSCHRMMADHN